MEARPFANFAPSIWRNYFESFSFNNTEKEAFVVKVEALKGEVKSMLVACTRNPLENIKLIDLLSHLGVSYHFEKEIEEQLVDLFSSYMLIVNEIGDDLNNIALLFRVLRQNGYYVPSDVFCKFKDNNGKFKEDLTRDIKGMMSLYEAAHLRVHEEEILEEALKFTTIHLKAYSTQSSNTLAKQVEHCLDYSIHKAIPRVEARYFIDIYEQDECHNDIILDLAKTDYNLVQVLHREEQSQITRWHRGLTMELSYVRDRATELYLLMMSLCFEPHFSRARIIHTKIVSIISFLDDTYDAYATVEECEKLTNAIKRWNINGIDELPDYMIILYRALLNLFDNLDQEMSKEGRSHVVNNAKKHVIALACAFNQEAKWCNDDYVPKLDEYLVTALKSAAGQAVFAASFIGMGEIAGYEAIEWLNTFPKITQASNRIARLLDDIKSHKFEQDRRHVASAVECYMKQHGVEIEEAVNALNKMVEDSWKDINEECLKPTSISIHILSKVVNYARSCDFIYKHIDGYTNPEALKDTIASLFVDKIPT